MHSDVDPIHIGVHREYIGSTEPVQSQYIGGTRADVATTRPFHREQPERTQFAEATDASARQIQELGRWTPENLR